MNKPDLRPTAELVVEMAATLRRTAGNLDRLSAGMQRSGDIYYASDVASVIANLLTALRLDLLVGRPINAFTKVIAQAEFEELQGE
jgi:hypothetical protein